MSQHARRDVAERAVLGPIQNELLESDAVEFACSLIREHARAEITQVEGSEAPQVAEIAAQISDLEDLIVLRQGRAAALGPVIAQMREKMAGLQRASWRKANAIQLAAIPAEDAYRAAVADLAARASGVEH